MFSYQDIYLCVLQSIKKRCILSLALSFCLLCDFLLNRKQNHGETIEEDRLFLKTLRTDLLKMKNAVKVIQKWASTSYHLNKYIVTAKAEEKCTTWNPLKWISQRKCTSPFLSGLTSVIWYLNCQRNQDLIGLKSS